MFEGIKRYLAPAAPMKEAPKPITEIRGGGNDKSDMYKRLGLYGGQRSHMKECRDWRKMYRRGGPAAACIDAYPLFVLSNGYRFCCEKGNEDLKQKVVDWADQPHVNFEQIMWQGVLDAIICGTAFQEIIPDNGQFGIWGIIPRDASSFEMVYDDFGRIKKYNQIVDEGFGGLDRRTVNIPTERLLSITLFPIPGEMYGASLTERAYDDIMRDCDMIESITCGVHRHGTAKNHVRIGQPGESIATADMDAVKQSYSRVGAKNDWITNADVEIRSIDTSLASLGEYHSITLQRMAAAFGVPDELVGMGRGSTEATATVRLTAFYGTITTIQGTLARIYSQAIIDRITGVPGSVWLEFNEVSDSAFYQKAAAFAQLRTGMDPDAVIPAAWARVQLGIPEDEDVLEQGEEEMKPYADTSREEPETRTYPEGSSGIPDDGFKVRLTPT